MNVHMSEGKNECMNESIHTANSEHACHAFGCANLCSIDAYFDTCKSVMLLLVCLIAAKIAKAQQDMVCCPYLNFVLCNLAVCAQ